MKSTGLDTKIQKLYLMHCRHVHPKKEIESYLCKHVKQHNTGLLHIAVKMKNKSA